MYQALLGEFKFENISQRLANFTPTSLHFHFIRSADPCMSCSERRPTAREHCLTCFQQCFFEQVDRLRQPYCTFETQLSVRNSGSFRPRTSIMHLLPNRRQSGQFERSDQEKNEAAIQIEIEISTAVGDFLSAISWRKTKLPNTDGIEKLRNFPMPESALSHRKGHPVAGHA